MYIHMCVSDEHGRGLRRGGGGGVELGTCMEGAFL